MNVQGPLTAFDQTFPYRVQKRGTASVQIISPNGTVGKLGLYSNSWVDHDFYNVPADSSGGHSIRVSGQGSGYFQFSFVADAEVYD